jgi:hypothetical protein
MNDFTKEELKHIHDALDILRQLGWEKFNILFRNKIQSLIENYCEHDTEEGWGGSRVCHKCGSEFV